MEMIKPASIRLAVPNAILFIQDPDRWDPPEPTDDSGVWSNPSGIAVSCLPDSEGDTDITIGPVSEVGRTHHLLFDGHIDTPTRKLLVLIVPGKTVLEQDVQNQQTRVRIWTDGHPATEIV